jgi:hypothetical protein
MAETTIDGTNDTRGKINFKDDGRYDFMGLSQGSKAGDERYRSAEEVDQGLHV